MSENGKDHTRFSFLFKKYIDESCSNIEAKQVVSDLEDSGNDISILNEAGSHWDNLNTKHNEDLLPIENRFRMERILDRLHHRIRLNEEQSSRKYQRQNRFFMAFAKVAAIIVLPLLVYSIYLTSESLNARKLGAKQVVWQTIKTPVGMQTDFLLPDGSHVWLNAGSVFKYPVSFSKGNRQVELIGEAFFDITKDAIHPFIVMAGEGLFWLPYVIFACFGIIGGGAALFLPETLNVPLTDVK